MAEFKITTNDGQEFTIEAADEAAATAVFNGYQSKNYTGPADANGVPEGMVLDLNTGAMVDTKAMADKYGTNLGTQAARGVPFVGSWLDEMAGYLSSSDKPYDSQEVNTEFIRQVDKNTEAKYPKTTTGLKIAGGLSTVPAAIAAAPAVIPANAGLLTQPLIGGTVGGLTGATEGAITGAGEQVPGKRIEGAKEGAAIGATLGTVLGGAAPMVTAGVKKAANTVLDQFTVNKNLAKAGISRPAAAVATRALNADDALGIPGAKRMVAIGPDAMLADAGDSAANLLDATIAKSGRGANIASNAVEERAAKADKTFKMVLDKVLGSPEGVNKAAKDISSKTSSIRKAAYDAAYNAPIDYASTAGRKIEDVFSRVPKGIMKSAIDEANDAMTAAGLKNMQIMADIADDGTISFRQMPNMRQVDELKRALNTVSKSSVDQFGRKTAAGIRADTLAKELRDAAVEANGKYGAALKLGGDKIAEDDALKLGYDLLDPSVTRENVKEAVNGITDAERTQLALGLRQKLDDVTANVKIAISDNNIDAREALKAVKDLTTRASREKIVDALGEQKATAIYREVDRLSKALELKANVVRNSKTAQRQAVQSDVRASIDSGTIDAIKEGRPLEAPRRMWQSLTGATPEAKAAKEEQIYAEIANLLTGARGPDAMRALQSLMDAYVTGNANQTAARNVGRSVTGALALPAYQTGTQQLRSK